MAKEPALTFARLLDWVEGRIPAPAAEQVAAQVAQADPAVRAAVAWLEAFHTLSAQLHIEAPPAATRALLRRRFEAYALQRRTPSLLRRVLATLSFDSGAQALAPGLRSAGVQDAPRQLIYSTELADLALNMLPRAFDQQIDLHCQIFPKQADQPMQVALELRGEAMTSTGVADELGEWTFEAILAGHYTLIMRAGDVEVVVESLELRL